MIDNSWRHFCEYTSIHGLHYIYSSQHERKRRYRIIWTIVFLTMVSITIWNCTNNVIAYLNFDVKTSYSYETKKELTFPAITLCNENTFRKWVVANTPFVLLMSTITAKSLEEITSLSDMNDKTCSFPNRTTPDLFQLKSFQDQYLKYSMISIMQMITTDSSSVVKCYWNNVEFKCAGSFLNHVDTLGSCFTFNVNEDIINAAAANNGSISNFGYGLNTTNYSTKKQLSYGQNNGLRLVLNVNQSDYCGVSRKWYGAGYRTYVHDSQTFISYYINPPLQIQPGYDTSVAIRTVQFNRDTENLGLCSEFVYLWMSPFARVYSQLGCFIQCGTEFVWNKCHCFPPYGQLYTKKAADALNVPEVSLRLCAQSDVECIISYQQKLININYAAECQLCKRPCHETKYEYTITSTRLRSDLTFIDSITDPKNILTVNYYFDDMDLLTIHESQSYTIIDLFTYFGGIIGLFLGMSAMSTGELIYQIIYWLHYLYDKRQNRIQVLKRSDHRRFSSRLSAIEIENLFVKRNYDQMRRTRRRR